MKRTILIADDDAKTRNALTKTLESQHYDLVEAESGEQALALATALRIDVFLLGMEMGRMNGALLCQEFRAIERYHETPIILLARNSSDTALHRALAAGG